MNLNILYKCITDKNQIDNLKYLLNNKTVLIPGYQDEEVTLKKGYFVQVSSSKPNKTNYSMYYTPLKPLNFINLENKKYLYDFMFVGRNTHPFRVEMYNKIKNSLIGNNYINFYNKKYNQPFCNDDFLNLIKESRFVLCPRGRGYQSLRFYETLMMNRVPIFITDKNDTKLPLDWIINWKDAIFIINDLNNLNKKLEEIFSLSETAYKNYQDYICYIYNNYLTHIYIKKYINLLIENINKNQIIFKLI